jgi:D-aspartate ligase
LASAAPSLMDLADRASSTANADQLGALVIGADYRGLTVVRSLGRHGIPVWVLVGQQAIAAKSRYALRWFPWPQEEREQLHFLLQFASEHNLQHWFLVPTDDRHAALIARNQTVLQQHFTIATSPWKTVKWAYDKRLTYRLARALKIAAPRTAYPRTREQVAQLDFSFPAILKPAFKETDNCFTRAKAWLVHDHEELVVRYDDACRLVGSRAVMIQELIPGSGEHQFAFGALCLDGKPLATVTARRLRQYPIAFGRSSSYVETIDNSKVEEDARRLLQALHFTGLVEVEFKHDPRDGQYKILDVNPRVWGWHTIGLQAGIDFPYLLWRLAYNKALDEVHAPSGCRWLRMATDIPATTAGIWQGVVSPKVYIKGLRLPREAAVFARDDLLPVALEIPMLVALWLKQLYVAGQSSPKLSRLRLRHARGVFSSGLISSRSTLRHP